MSDLSDHLLMEKTGRGDAEAFATLVTRHGRPVFRFISSFTGDPDLAADVTQEAFTRVFVHAGSYRPEGSFTTWLYRIALNAAVDEKRRRRRFRFLPLFGAGGSRDYVPEPPCDSHEHEILRDERRRLVREAVVSLPARYRAALVLKDIEELPYDEVARVLGCPVGTAKSRVNRARWLLKGKLTRMHVCERPSATTESLPQPAAAGSQNHG